MSITNLESAEDSDEISQGGKIGGDAEDIEIVWNGGARTSPSRIPSREFLTTSSDQCVFQGSIGGGEPGDEGGGFYTMVHCTTPFRFYSNRCWDGEWVLTLFHLRFPNWRRLDGSGLLQ